jgi:hypothetical protein
MPARWRVTTLATALLAGLLSFSGSVTGPARATDGRAAAQAAAAPSGCWMVASDGGIFAFGDAKFYGSTGAIKLNQPITGMAASPTGAGYWLVASDGGIFAFGDAKFYGSTGAIKLNRPITGMAPTPSGAGYWLVASDGGIFAFGDAKFYGSTGAIKLNKPIAGMAATPTGRGYWLVATDGGIFSFGDAAFGGSTGAVKLNQPIAGMAATPTGRGYWLTASDGGIFSFGDAAFYGAAPSRPSSRGARTVTAMVPSATGGGYWQAATSGELLAFGDAPDLGGGVSSLTRPIVGMAVLPRPGRGPNGPGTPGGPAPPGPSPGTPPGTAPVPAGPAKTFSSTAIPSWGTAADDQRPGYSQAVKAIAEYGNRVFVAGEFAGVVDQTGAAGPGQYLLELDPATGQPIPGSTFAATANPDGPVLALAVAPDRHRLYVAGKFSRIGGVNVHRLAALNLDTGAFDPAFDPPEPNAYINTLALAGGRLYLGGAFANLLTDTGTVDRPGIAAVDAASGKLDTGFVPPQNYGGVYETHTGEPVEDPADGSAHNPGVVNALAVPKGGKSILVGGNFLHLGTAPADDPNHERGGLVSLDPATGKLTSWQPVHKRPVFGLTVWPGDGTTVFTAAGGAGGRLEAFQPGGKTTPLWTGQVDGDAMAVAATTTRVYLVGHYDHQVPDKNDPCLKLSPQPPDGHMGVSCPNGTPHRHLAAFEAQTGNVDPSFTAQANTNEGPEVAYAGVRYLYVGGNFREVSDTPQANYRNQPGLAVYPAAS